MQNEMSTSHGAQAGWFFGGLVYFGLLIVALALIAQLVSFPPTSDTVYANATLWLIVGSIVLAAVGMIHKVILGVAMLVMIPAFALGFVVMKQFTANSQSYIFAAVAASFMLIAFVVTAVWFWQWVHMRRMMMSGKGSKPVSSAFSVFGRARASPSPRR